MSSSNQISEKELKKSLTLVTLAAALGLPFFSITTGPALTGFVRLLGSNDFVFSVIMAMPVFGAFVQVFFSYFMMNSGKRKVLFIISGFIHRPVWFIIAFIPFLLQPEKTKSGIIMITILIAISSVANSITGMSFNSWMGSLVPAGIKGRFFSKRTMIYTITGGMAALASGLMLDRINGFTGYAVVFVFAAVMGTLDILMFFWIKDPPMEITSQKDSFIKLFAEPFKDSNYLKYMLFVAFWYFAVNFAGPFFNVYMIEELKMDFLLISLFSPVASNITTVIFIRFWGKLADKYGSKPVMFFCCIILITLPFAWVFVTPQSIWSILFINLLGGVFWPGFEMTAMNQSIWLAPEKNRSIYIANYTLVVILIGTAAAYVCGGAFMQTIRNVIPAEGYTIFGNFKFGAYQFLFSLSFLFRLTVLLFGIDRFHENGSKSPGYMLNDLRGLMTQVIRKHNKAG